MDVIGISKFCLDMTNLEGKRALNRPGVFAGANFIALRRGLLIFVHALFHGAKHSPLVRRLHENRVSTKNGCQVWLLCDLIY